MNVDLTNVTSEQLEELLRKKKQQEHSARVERRNAYEGIRADVVKRIEDKVRSVVFDVENLQRFVCDEALAFRDVMEEYGQLRREKQLSYTLREGNFKMEVKTNRIKKFDERADVAASRLIEFLTAWIENSEKGTDDPMYQLAMTLLERNKYGDLDYKSISKLYDLEERFGDEQYSSIMSLFREANVVESTATNFYFYELGELGVWRKLEPSFNRL